MTTTPPNTSTLAAQFLELWQQQIASSMKDPAMTAQMLENFRLMQQSALMMMQNYAPQQPHTGPAVPRNGNPALLELERRIRECEARLAALEKQPEKQGGGTA
jgi:hypothetical protein